MTLQFAAWIRYMFKNLSTSTKLFILCATFVVPIVVATYELFAEKQSAIDFTNKEISGVRQPHFLY